MNSPGPPCQWEWRKVLNVCLNALFVLPVSLCHTSRCWEQKARPHVVSATVAPWQRAEQCQAKSLHRLYRQDWRGLLYVQFFILLARKPPWFFFVSVSSFVLLFQGHLLVGNKWSDNDMICVAEGGKITDAMAVHGSRIFPHFQGNQCLLFNPAHLLCLLPPNREILSAQTLHVSLFSLTAILQQLWGKHCRPLLIYQEVDRGPEPQRYTGNYLYLWGALEELHQTCLYRVTRRVWDISGN